MEINRLAISGLNIYTEAGVLEKESLVIENGIIKSIGHYSRDSATRVISFPPNYHLVPGRIDLHIHGAGGADVMDGTREALATLASHLPAEGITGFLATTMTAEKSVIEKAIANAGKYMAAQDERGAEMLGIHLEGPFLSLLQAGAHPLSYIVKADLNLFDHWQTLASGGIRIVTLAPEMDGAIPFIRYLHSKGVVASIGHSHGTYEQAIEGMRAGATQVTHLFNAMRGLHHRDPGVVGAALLNDKVKAEIIVDGFHVRKEMVKFSYRLKGRDGIILVTDAMRAKCMGDGEYELSGQPVYVTGGKAALKNGTLAGSVLKMDEAIRNIMENTGCTLEDTIVMASVNPAKQIHVFHRKGSIKVGKDADLVILNEDYQVAMTLCRGRVVYER